MRLIRLAVILCVLSFIAGDAARPSNAQQAPAAVEVRIVKYKDLCEFIQAQKGKVVLIDFWATFCVPCKASFPHTVEMYKSYKDKGLVVVSVATDRVETGEEGTLTTKVLKFLKTNDATFTNVILNESAELMADKLRMDMVPCLYVFNRDGQWTQFIGDNLKPDANHRHVDVQRYVEYALLQTAKN